MEKSTRPTKKINLRAVAMLALLALLVGTMLVGCGSKTRQDARVEARTKARAEDRIDNRRN